LRGFLYLAKRPGLMKDAVCEAPRVRSLGRRAQGDVDAGDARRGRAMDKVRP